MNAVLFFMVVGLICWSIKYLPEIACAMDEIERLSQN